MQGVETIACVVRRCSTFAVAVSEAVEEAKVEWWHDDGAGMDVLGQPILVREVVERLLGAGGRVTENDVVGGVVRSTAIPGGGAEEAEA